MTDHQIVHATCVAWYRRAVLIQGASGSGKSALGLMLMGMGCALVADDRVRLHKAGAQVVATAPDTIRNMIEARHVGLIRADAIDQANVVLAVDMDATAQQRLPERREVTLLGTKIPLIHRADGPHFASSILQILKAGWSER